MSTGLITGVGTISIEGSADAAGLLGVGAGSTASSMWLDRARQFAGHLPPSNVPKRHGSGQARRSE